MSLIVRYDGAHDVINEQVDLLSLSVSHNSVIQVLIHQVCLPHVSKECTCFCLNCQNSSQIWGVVI